MAVTEAAGRQVIGAGAVGRVVAPDPYVLRGLLRCGMCERVMLPVYVPAAGRGYSCGPRCEQPDVAAEAAETDLLLGALIRCAVTRHPDLGAPGGDRAGQGLPAVSAEELRRWQRCDTSDRRAVLLTAYTRVLVNFERRLRPVWRRGGDGDTTAGGRTGKIGG